ncbi:putative cyclin-dependent kinase F-2 [Setaria viridis]|uniref:putative cyclin-dependent kinase F-2 n=1 Tax=Setaria viridis TaxID=4556 RepID=UPI00149347DD|nr:putative cyclin-dependent kinase F-2 [Setaria viridis]
MGRPAAAAAGGSRKRRRVSVGSTEHYEEVSRLGEGNFGAVVKARHRVTGQTVAIKRLTTAADDAAEDPMREASLHEACGDHPFIVGFHGLARDPATSRICLVTECVDGPSLHDYLDHRSRGGFPPLPEPTVRAVMWQLLTAAKAMHSAGVIHRDIKPENILVSGDRRSVKFCDFGLAMSMSDAPPYEQAGTLSYKAPEMMLEMPVYDARVDAWSLGCVMAEIINNGGLPLQGDGEDGQLRAIFDVLGVPDDETWPEFSSTPFAAKVVPELQVVHRKNCLRELFPEAALSKEGFEVLDGLLTCNPGKRLTADAALKHQWFAKVDALELPMKDEVASALPGKKKLRMAPAACAKRRKLQCV